MRTSGWLKTSHVNRSDGVLAPHKAAARRRHGRGRSSPPQVSAQHVRPYRLSAARAGVGEQGRAACRIRCRSSARSCRRRRVRPKLKGGHVHADDVPPPTPGRLPGERGLLPVPVVVVEPFLGLGGQQAQFVGTEEFHERRPVLPHLRSGLLVFLSGLRVDQFGPLRRQFERGLRRYVSPRQRTCGAASTPRPARRRDRADGDQAGADNPCLGSGPKRPGPCWSTCGTPGHRAGSAGRASPCPCGGSRRSPPPGCASRAASPVRGGGIRAGWRGTGPVRSCVRQGVLKRYRLRAGKGCCSATASLNVDVVMVETSKPGVVRVRSSYGTAVTAVWRGLVGGHRLSGLPAAAWFGLFPFVGFPQIAARRARRPP